MASKELIIEKRDTLEYINESALFCPDTPRGDVAIELLRQSLLTAPRRSVALLVRTQELIRQNPPR